MQIIKDNDKAIIRHFDSVGDALEYSRTPSEANRDSWQEFETRKMGKEWYGTEGEQAKVRELINIGWTEGAAKLEKQSGAIQADNPPKPVNIRRRRSWADQGDSLDIARVYAGSSEAWQRCIKTPANTNRYIEVLVDLCISYGTQESVIFWRGAAALVLSDLMQAAGYAVKITAGVNVSKLFEGSRKKSVDTFTVKDYQQPLDIVSLSSVVCLAGFFRLVWFQLATTHKDRVTSGLGHVEKLESGIKLEPHQIGDLSSVNDARSAKVWIQAAIDKIQNGQQQDAA